MVGGQILIALCNRPPQRLPLSWLLQNSITSVPPTEHPILSVKPSILTAALFCLLLGTARAESYQLVTEEWAPYNYVQNGQLTGMATEIVRAIMALTGDTFEVAVLPSMRAGMKLQQRPRTIMFSMFRTPEREPLYKWVGPL